MTAAKPDIQAIFNEAIARDSAEKRSEYLDEMCGDNPQIRNRVEALLLAHSEAGGFFGGQPTVTEVRPIGEKPGTRIGPYKLLQEIGEGGMGVVFMAEQTEPVQRRVALKIIKPGMDTRQVIARFEAERQALAMMDHPNIAKVLDAGQTDSGRPYFVMELVNGIPVTQFCDEQHLTARERLELFIPICRAVQHAHQKGIIHRDIKPTNILMALYDGKPVPKVIDFGVAKAISQKLTEKTMFTGIGQIVGTIEYMSPEQAQRNQLDIDTRSDVYSLGVVLYELLSGDTPFDKKRLRSAAIDELLRIIREEEPPKPSTKLSSSEKLASVAANRHIEPARLSALVRGELDWIVMKALEKDRARRYETATSLAADVAHYLNDEAVVACPPSTAYRFRKFARRNKAPLAITAATTMTLVLAATGSFIAAVRFERLASDNAQLVNDKTQLAENLQVALAESQTNLSLAREQEQQANTNLGLATTEQQRAEGNLDLALTALDAVYLDAIGTEKLLGEPRSRPQAGDVGFSPAASVPLTDLEKELLKRGLSFYDRFSQQNAATPRAAVQTAQAYYRVGLLQAALGDHAAAESAYRASVERFEALVSKEPNNVEYHRRLAESYRGLSFNITNWDDAKPWLERSIGSYTTAIRLAPENAELHSGRGWAYHEVGQIAEHRQDLPMAADLAPDNLQFQFDAALCLYWSGSDSGRRFAERALQLDPDGFQGYLAMAFASPKDGQEHLKYLSLAIERNPNAVGAIAWRAQAYHDRGEFEKSRADGERAVELAPDNFHALQALGRTYISLGKYQEAEQTLKRAINSNPHHWLAFVYYGELQIAQGHFAEAVEPLSHAFTLQPSAWWVLKRRAEAFFPLGRFAEALADLTKALEMKPEDTSTLVWIPPATVAKCPDEAFKEGLLRLAETAIETSDDPSRARRDRIALYLGLGELDLARRDFATLLTSENKNPYDHYTHALLCLRFQDEAGYRASCQTMVERLSDTDDDDAANFAAWTCSLIPGALGDYTRAIVLAKKSTEAQPDNTQFLNSLGAVLYRAGRQQEAIQVLSAVSEQLDKPGASPNMSSAYTWYVLALAHQQSGNEEQAHEFLNKATAATDAILADEANPPTWNRRFTLELLRREATTAIENAEEKLPDNVQPSDEEEQKSAGTR